MTNKIAPSLSTAILKNQTRIHIWASWQPKGNMLWWLNGPKSAKSWYDHSSSTSPLIVSVLRLTGNWSANLSLEFHLFVTDRKSPAHGNKESSENQYALSSPRSSYTQQNAKYELLVSVCELQIHGCQIIGWDEKGPTGLITSITNWLDIWIK